MLSKRNLIFFERAQSRDRTDTVLLPKDFKSFAPTNYATRAYRLPTALTIGSLTLQLNSQATLTASSGVAPRYNAA